MVAPVQLVRLSPSGPELGTPPAQVGGGALIAGRMWTAQGTGAVIDVPNPVADVPGLGAVPVDMRAGYTYDVEVDTMAFGTGGNFQVLVLGSTNGGGTYTAVGLGGNVSQLHTGCARLRLPSATGPWDHLKVQINTSDVAGATCQYAPALTALKVQEYST